jgi:membrane protein implicated in regulation of membrane protease activity
VERIPKSVYLRYILINAPALAGFVFVLGMISHWFALPGWLLWLLIACWIIKDAMLFPLVWRAYHPERPSVTGALVGKRGIVMRRLNPSGYIQVHGELWKAERLDEGPPIETGQSVRIHDVKRLTLYVTPDDIKKTRSGPGHT